MNTDKTARQNAETEITRATAAIDRSRSPSDSHAGRQLDLARAFLSDGAYKLAAEYAHEALLSAETDLAERLRSARTPL